MTRNTSEKPGSKPVQMAKPTPIHPIANMLPEMTDAQYAALKAGIALHGQQVPIELFEGKILEGRHRERACRELGIKPKYQQWAGDGSPEDYVISMNINRRHLSASQLAALSVSFAEHFKSRAKERMRAGGKGKGVKRIPTLETGRANDQLARAFGTNARYASNAQKIARHSPSLLKQVLAGDKTIPQASLIVSRETRHVEMKQKAAAAPKSGLWKIVTGDCIEHMATLESRRFRLIFADAPYNIGKNYGDGSKADRLAPAAYVEWCGKWIDEAARLLAADGSLWMLISEDYAADFVMLGRKAGLKQASWVIWNVSFGMYRHSNFGKCAAHLLRFVRDPDNCVFHPDAVIVPGKGHAIYKDKRRNPAGKISENVWSDIPRENANSTDRMPKDFPTQLPVALLDRIIGCASDPGDEILDPFTGTGTTGVSAVGLGRRFYGIEKSPAFAKGAETRLRAADAGRASK
jgi:DNA modification methylase